MSSYLAGHPDVFMARKEMHYFGADLRFGRQFYRRGTKEYLAEFEGWNGQRCAGEGSVWYLFSRQAAAEIKAFSPNARVIVMLREPVEMLYSLYHTFRWDGNEHLPTFEEALAAENDRRAERRTARQTYFAQGLVYREAARYAEQIRSYFDIFGRERVHVILYEDFAADVPGVLHKTLDFLEVDSKCMQKDFKPVNGNKSVRNRLVRSIQQDRFVRSAALAIRPWLPQRMFTLMQKVDALIRKCNARPQVRPPLQPELLARLKREFAPEVQRLSELLRHDLTHWSREGISPLSGADSSPSFEVS
jgi:Sulfotransferase domain